jgi:hypothetical protein
MRSPVLAAVALALACLAGCGGGHDSLDILDSPGSDAPAVTVPADPPSTPTGEPEPDRVWVCATIPDNGKRPVVFSDAACPTDRTATSELGESGIGVKWYSAPSGTPTPDVGAPLPEEYVTSE